MMGGGGEELRVVGRDKPGGGPDPGAPPLAKLPRLLRCVMAVVVAWEAGQGCGGGRGLSAVRRGPDGGGGRPARRLKAGSGAGERHFLPVSSGLVWGAGRLEVAGGSEPQDGREGKGRAGEMQGCEIMYA